MGHYRAMISEINLRYTVIIKLLKIWISLPKYAIAVCRYSLLFACIVLIRPEVVFVGRHEFNSTLLELLEEHILVYIFRVLLILFLF
jgi:hypothetical protein